MKHRFTVLVLFVDLTSSLLGGLLGKNVSAGSEPAQNSPNEFLREFTEAVDVIQKTHVDNVSGDKLIYSAIKGMLRALDPHSSFFDPKEFKRLREEQHSKYFGLGIRVRTLLRGDRGKVVIVEPPSIDSPAQRRGLRAGDVISKIEGEASMTGRRTRWWIICAALAARRWKSRWSGRGSARRFSSRSRETRSRSSPCPMPSR